MRNVPQALKVSILQVRQKCKLLVWYTLKMVYSSVKSLTKALHNNFRDRMIISIKKQKLYGR